MSDLKNGTEERTFFVISWRAQGSKRWFQHHVEFETEEGARKHGQEQLSGGADWHVYRVSQTTTYERLP